MTASEVGESLEPSPFVHTTPVTEAGSLAILHLKRGFLQPITLRSESNDDYAEGAVTNTRFGSFPHSTLIGLEWGSQVRASKVNTGAKGRKNQKLAQEAKNETPNAVPSNKKRKADQITVENDDAPTKKAKREPDDLNANNSAPTPAPSLEAGSGFVHILPPTAEAWTSSLDHRTQVVYTPDYSYILQRLRVKPGSTIIEAGAGSGSFTHAAARAVFNGCAYGDQAASDERRKPGKVYSYEYHGPRADALREEIKNHRLKDTVHLTHQDVCTDGFAFPTSVPPPAANAIFLDLPAPWLALNHLTRSSAASSLDPTTAIHLCTFSPCIEQVMATVSTLRKTGWTEIDMVEIANKRIDVRRENIGLKNEGLRGVNASAATVEEAIGRLKEVEGKLADFHANRKVEKGGEAKKVQSKAERLEQVRKAAESRKLYKEGMLVHRSESEVKTHTSYLVFATLPRAWTEEDEEACALKWPIEDVMQPAEVKP